MKSRKGLQKVDNRRIKNNRMMWAIAHELGYDTETLHIIVKSMIGKEHISKLTTRELTQINRRLLEEIKNKTRGYYKMRKKIYALCYKLGWEKNGRVDTNRLNGFIFRITKKKNIYCCMGKDLQKIVIAFESMIKWDEKHEN